MGPEQHEGSLGAVAIVVLVQCVSLHDCGVAQLWASGEHLLVLSCIPIA